ncbi:hypothetical protein TRAPUB_10188 [Trametes pubescens]|uniref:Fungal-type protein kinase domain-containing protein n=1 Tax=Trametes pubescens TaxID=154538 RepID=A0A1M2W0D6_TRAPU|nr:hypothetical protein TRAPUB_10188 [Trametes pubescens]
MADVPIRTPASYHSDLQNSPSRLKAKTVNSSHLDTPSKPNAELDRLLEVWDSMDLSVLITLEEFEKNILWPEANRDCDVPRPSQQAIDTMTKGVNEIFFTKDGKRRQIKSEDAFASAVVRLSSDLISQMFTSVHQVPNIINKIGLPGDLRAALSQYSYNATDADMAKVDAALYPTTVAPDDGRPDWTRLRLFIEFKSGGVENDPFDDKSSQSPESWAQSRAKVRGQLLAYASKTFQYQHRTALYSLLINGDEFRGMYWDRSALITTEATNYVEDPGSLLRFLWAFASLTDEQQGIDPTATLLSKDDEHFKLMDLCARANPALDAPFAESADVSLWFSNGQSGAFPDGPTSGTRQKSEQSSQSSEPVFKYVRDWFRDSLIEGWPRYRLLVGKEKREFLVASPNFNASSMFGRGTRGYVAWDVQNHRFVWLKDSWRPFYEGVEPEGNYLEKMVSKPGIKLTVPTVVTHGDVLQQTTFAAEYISEQSQSETSSAEGASDVSTNSKKRAREDDTEEKPEPEASVRPRLFIHYRIAVEEVCLKMGDFTNGKQLVRLILNCVVTHRDAYDHFNLLHRDISTGNLLILPQVVKMSDGSKLVGWRGLLTDWELAKYVPKDNSKQRARQPERTGTWQFMSVSYVRNPSLPVGVADELESFLHVLVYYGVRYLRHTLEGAVTMFIIDYFDTFQVLNGDKTRCSSSKINAVTHGVICVDESVLKFKTEKGSLDHPLNELLQRWLSLFVARYRTISPEDGALAAPKVKDAQTTRRPLPRVQELEAIMGGYLHNSEVLEEVLPIHPIVAAVTANDAVTVAEWAKRAKVLDTHKETEAILRNSLKASEWPLAEDDVVKDQLSKGYNPKRHFAVRKSTMVSGSTLASGYVSAAKRAKLDAGAAGASRSTPATSDTPPILPPEKQPTFIKLSGRRAPRPKPQT